MTPPQEPTPITEDECRLAVSGTIDRDDKCAECGRGLYFRVEPGVELAKVLPAETPETVTLPPSYAEALMRARVAAKPYGWAIALHGSGVRDLDLVAIPWTEDACAPEYLMLAVKSAVKGYVAENKDKVFVPTVKPHGRLCWSIHLGGGPFIDLSVMPLAQPPTEGAPAWTSELESRLGGRGQGAPASEDAGEINAGLGRFQAFKELGEWHDYRANEIRCEMDDPEHSRQYREVMEALADEHDECARHHRGEKSKFDGVPIPPAPVEAPRREATVDESVLNEWTEVVARTVEARYRRELGNGGILDENGAALLRLDIDLALRTGAAPSPETPTAPTCTTCDEPRDSESMRARVCSNAFHLPAGWSDGKAPKPAPAPEAKGE